MTLNSSRWRTFLSTILTFGMLIFLCSCAAPFKPIVFDPENGLAPTFVKVEEEAIQIFEPVKGINSVSFIYLNAYDGVSRKDGGTYENFLRETLREIGFETEILNKRELSMLVIQSDLSDQVANISDLISLNKLAQLVGPYLIIEASIYHVTDVMFRCKFSIIDPHNGKLFLKIDRTRTNWIDFDKEINYPIINVLKHWYEESSKLDSVEIPEMDNPKMPSI